MCVRQFAVSLPKILSDIFTITLGKESMLTFGMIVDAVQYILRMVL